MSKTTNIMIVGVGGQGTLLTSRILGKLALTAGYDVKISEVHGMSQRGGSVVTYVRYGDKVAEPIVEEGQADVLIAFEKLEALRYLHIEVLVEGSAGVTVIATLAFPTVGYIDTTEAVVADKVRTTDSLEVQLT